MRLGQIADERVGVCVSGGLSSLAVASSLADAGLNVTALVADIGQAPADEISALAGSLRAAGIPAEVVGLRDQMAELALDLVACQARYEGGYWNSTSSSRRVLVQGLGAAALAGGATVLAHGCVGGGNDERRFAGYTGAVPGLRPFVPWADPEMLERFPGRAEMQKYARERGLAVARGCSEHHSVDGNLAGFSHEGTELEDLATPDSAAHLQLATPAGQVTAGPEEVSVRVERGMPVAVSGSGPGPRAVLEQANLIAGRHGIGVRSVIENRINGTKCRGVYESPGLDLLGFCVAKAYELSADREARLLLGQLSDVIARGVYEGRYDSGAVTAARAAAAVLAQSASATVTVELRAGTMSFAGLAEHAAGQAAGPLPRRQTRFGAGGHVWQVTA